MALPREQGVKHAIPHQKEGQWPRGLGKARPPFEPSCSLMLSLTLQHCALRHSAGSEGGVGGVCGGGDSKGGWGDCREWRFFSAIRILGRLTVVPTSSSERQIGPPGFWLSPPLTHIRKSFLRKKMKFIKGPRTWRSILSYTNFFLPLTLPPPRYSVNQPRSKGLATAARAFAIQAKARARALRG